MEDANGGLPLNFTNVSNVHTGEMVGPDWWEVFLPCWIAESFVVLVSTLAMYFHLGGSRNTRLLHMNSNAQAIGAAIFKVTLMQRLQSESGSWLNAFSPMYASMMVQSLLHYHKEADARGKRPGFPLGIPHLLALVVSFKLDGAFNYDESSWANVLWCAAAAASVRGPFRPFPSRAPLTPSSPRPQPRWGPRRLPRRVADARRLPRHPAPPPRYAAAHRADVPRAPPPRPRDLRAALVAIRLTLWLDGDVGIHSGMIVPYPSRSGSSSSSPRSASSSSAPAASAAASSSSTRATTTPPGWRRFSW